MTEGLDSITDAVQALAHGGPVLVVDDEDRENEGDLILAAELATTENIAFLVRHTSGVLCVPLTGEDCDRLDLPPMTAHNQDPKGTAYTVSVDASSGVSTGISAADRARTMRLLADPRTAPADLTRPGHVFPLRANPRGVLGRPGHTEAAVDLMRLAGLRPAGVIAEVVNDDGTMSRLPDLRIFAKQWDIPLISIADLIEYRKRLEHGISRVVETRLPPPTATSASWVTPTSTPARNISPSSTANPPVPMRSPASTPNASPATPSAPSVATAANNWTPPWQP